MTIVEAAKLRDKIKSEQENILWAVNHVFDRHNKQPGEVKYRVDATERDTGKHVRFHNEFDYEVWKASFKS